MEDKIVKVIMEQLGVASEAVKDEATLADLGVDDLDSVELCMALEEEFDIMIPEEDWPQMGDEDKFTVKQIRELVQNRLAAKKG